MPVVQVVHVVVQVVVHRVDAFRVLRAAEQQVPEPARTQVLSCGVW